MSYACFENFYDRLRFPASSFFPSDNVIETLSRTSFLIFSFSADFALIKQISSVFFLYEEETRTAFDKMNNDKL